jgi:hypothetical protein
MIFDTKPKQNVFLLRLKKNGAYIASSFVERGLLSDSLRDMVMNHLEKQILARLKSVFDPKRPERRRGDTCTSTGTGR